MANPYKRVYIENVKKWMAENKVKVAFGSAGLAIFYYLAFVGAIVPLSERMDVVCTDPVCHSSNYTFLAVKDAYFYPNESWFPEGVTLERTWGTGWRKIDLNKTWSKDVKYAVKFSMGNTYTIRYRIDGKAPWESVDLKMFSNCPVIEGYGKRSDYLDIARNENGEVDRFVGLDRAWTEYVECNPTNATKTAQERGMNAYVNYGNPDVVSIRVEYFSTESRSRKEEYVSAYTYMEEHKTFPNGTAANLSGFVPTYSVRTVNYTVDSWSGKAPNLKPGECVRARVYGELVFGPEHSIEHVPVVYGEEFKEYDWWNVTIQHKRLVTQDDKYPDAFLAGSQLWQINGSTIEIWCDFEAGANHTAWIYYNNATGKDVYCVNSTETGTLGTDLVNTTFPDTGNPWNANAKLVMHMNGTGAYDDSLSHNPCAVYGNTAARAGKIGQGLYFDGTHDNISCGNIAGLNSMANATFYLFANHTDAAAGDFVQKSGASTYNWLLYTGTTGVFSYYVKTTVTENSVDTGTHAANTWFGVAANYNGTYSNVYVDGAWAAKTAITGTIVTVPDSVIIGERWNSNDFAGVLDEIRLYGNQSDNATVINSTYWSMVTGFHFSVMGGELNNVDTDAPDMNFVYPTPSNNSRTTGLRNWVFVNVTGYEALSFCRLQNSTNNITMTKAAGNLSCWYNYTGLANGAKVYFRVFGNDTSGNANVSEWRLVTADTKAPDLWFTLPPTNNTVTQNKSYVFVNVSAGENIDSCDIELLTNNMSNPTFVSKYTNSNMDGARGVFVSGNYAHVVAYYDGCLQILNITDKTNPILIGGYCDKTYLWYSTSIFVSGNYDYVTTYILGKITTLNITDITSPTIASTFVSNQPTSVFVSGNYAYVTTLNQDSLLIMDVTNPAVPTYVGNFTNSPITTYFENPMWVYVSGNYAYVVDDNTNSLVIVNVTDPANPTYTGSYRNDTSMSASISVYVVGDYAYVAPESSSGLSVINVSNKTNPTQIGWYHDLTYLYGSMSVAVSGNYAYVAAYNAYGMAVIDVSDPTHPTLAGHYNNQTYLGCPTTIYVSGNYAYISDFCTDSLVILDINRKVHMNVSGNYCYYNITEQLNNTVLDFRVYANDSAGNVNVTGWRRATIYLNATYQDRTPPYYTNYGSNKTATMFYGQTLSAYAYWNDTKVPPQSAASNVSYYTFEWNASGSWANATPVKFTSTPGWSNITVKIPSTAIGKDVGFRIYANDTANNTNATSVIVFSVHATNITLSTQNFTLNLSSGNLTFNYSGTEVSWTNATPKNQTGTIGIFNFTVYDVVDIKATLNDTLPNCMYYIVGNSSYPNTAQAINRTYNYTIWDNVSSGLRHIWITINMSGCRVGNTADMFNGSIVFWADAAV